MGAADHTKHEGHGGAQVDPNIGAVHRTSGDCSGDAGGDGGDGQAIAMPDGTGNVLEALAKEVEVLGEHSGVDWTTALFAFNHGNGAPFQTSCSIDGSV